MTSTLVIIHEEAINRDGPFIFNYRRWMPIGSYR